MSADKSVTDQIAATKQAQDLKSQAKGLLPQLDELAKAREAASKDLQDKETMLAQVTNDLGKQKDGAVALSKTNVENESKAILFADALNSSSALASAMTDADGNFSLTLPRGGGEIFLVAQAARSVGLEKEYYFWVVPAVADNVSLNNSNLAKCSTLATSLTSATP